jgi:exonuclease SbcC
MSATLSELARLQRRLEPVVIAVGLAVDALERDTGIGDRILAAISEWSARDFEIREIDEALVGAVANLQKLDAVVRERAGAEAQARKSAETAASDACGLLQERQALLGGEPTRNHRTRHNLERLSAQTTLDEAKAIQASANAALEGARAHTAALSATLAAASARVVDKSRAANAALDRAGLSRDELNALIAVSEDVRMKLRQRLDALDAALAEAKALVGIREVEFAAAELAAAEIQALDVLEARAPGIDALFEDALAAEANLTRRIAEDEQRSSEAVELVEQLAGAERMRDEHRAVSDAIGSADGSRFRRIAQRITLRALVQHANGQLESFAPRYRIVQTNDENLGLWVVDQDMGSEIRSTRSLSGGERFLVSLSLALALAGLEVRGAFVQTLFIDEGFGSLDASVLDIAVDALEALQSSGRQVGVITHVQAMIDRITAQVRIEKEGGGKSRVVVAEAA